MKKDSVSGQNSLGVMAEMPGCHMDGERVIPGLVPTGYCGPSVCPATSMPATQPRPGPTCTAWLPAAAGLTSCPCLNETGAGRFGLSEWV